MDILIFSSHYPSCTYLLLFFQLRVTENWLTLNISSSPSSSASLLLVLLLLLLIYHDVPRSEVLEHRGGQGTSGCHKTTGHAWGGEERDPVSRRRDGDPVHNNGQDTARADEQPQRGGVDPRLRQIPPCRPLQGKEIFYLTTHSTHFILRLYGVGPL